MKNEHQAATGGDGSSGCEDLTTFILDQILTGVQFFRNYERDIELLRCTLFEEIKLRDHHKTCFRADSLHKLVAENVTFQARHGMTKNVEEWLHPLHTFVANDNLKAAYDASTLAEFKPSAVSNYSFIIRPCDGDKKEKSGFVNLIEYPRRDRSDENRICISPSPREPFYERNSKKNSRQYKSGADVKPRKTVGFDDKELNQVINNEEGDDDLISATGIYKYHKPRAGQNPIPIQEYRLDDCPETSHQIPRKCFQVVDAIQFLTDTINAPRKAPTMDSGLLSGAKNLLNSAAFKAHFCDVFCENLTDPLNMTELDLESGEVQNEFLIFNRNSKLNYVTSVIDIQDGNKYIKTERKGRWDCRRKLKWPSDEMEKVLCALPKCVVPNGYLEPFDENPDYEREWQIEFPKGEEYLCLHMMHSHIRCYLFALTIYKSFIEKEINNVSLGPKHLLHLLFWRVRKNFLAWPEEAPGYALLQFLEFLYRRLRNKSLPHFLLPGRNLFANSHPKDLHKAQSILKQVLDNPIPHVMKAVRNLKFDARFYPELDTTKLNAILKSFNPPPPKKRKKLDETRKKQDEQGGAKENDAELQWRKEVIKRIRRERKTEEEDEAAEERMRQSIDSVDIDFESVSNVKLDTPPACRLLKFFISHHLKMGEKSLVFEDRNQVDLYLFQMNKLLNLLPKKAAKPDEIMRLNRAIKSLSEGCAALSHNSTSPNKNISKHSKESQPDHNFDIHLNNKVENEKRL